MAATKTCEECGGIADLTRVFHSMRDFYSDGAYHMAYKCRLCGHEELIK